MQVQVLRAGVFNGPGHKSLPWANEGDLIEIADGPYAESLLTDHLVAPPAVDVPSHPPIARSASDGPATRHPQTRKPAR